MRGDHLCAGRPCQTGLLRLPDEELTTWDTWELISAVDWPVNVVLSSLQDEVPALPKESGRFFVVSRVSSSRKRRWRVRLLR